MGDIGDITVTDVPTQLLPPNSGRLSAFIVNTGLVNGAAFSSNPAVSFSGQNIGTPLNTQVSATLTQQDASDGVWAICDSGKTTVVHVSETP